MIPGRVSLPPGHLSRRKRVERRCLRTIPRLHCKAVPYYTLEVVRIISPNLGNIGAAAKHYAALPEERKLWTKAQMIDEMCSLIGGRVAEEIVNGQPSTGAQNDLERLTQLAYGMVQYYGMSEKVGLVSFYDSTGARGYDFKKPYSEKTAELMDEEVKKLIREIHDRTYKILTDNKEGFLKMAALLLEKEVIFAEDVENILGPKVLPAEDERKPKEEK